MKILILGGYGVFGGRLATLLSDLGGIELLICGRNLASAQAFCDQYQGLAKVRALQLDRRDIAAALSAEKPALVVDASGPFQDYGPQGYGVITACIDAGVDYLDFADAADFVFGVSQFDDQARAAGVFILSGVSSFPVLTAAVLREMAKTMDLVAVDGGIAPSPYAGIGLNVMRAVVGYAGAPVKLLRGGQLSHGIGLAESRRFTIAVPGRLPLRNIHFSLVDVPDLLVIPPDYPTLTDIWMGAGPVPEILHRMLNGLARLRARFSLPSLEPLSRLFFTVLNLMRFGEHRGGMFIRARGHRDGHDIEQSWHLLAEREDGPFIPSMATEAIIRKLLVGDRPAPGSRAATHALELNDYDPLFAGREIYTGFRCDDLDAPLYRHILGSAFDDLSPQVQALHDARTARRWSGQAEVRRGTGLIAKAIGRVIGFPGATRQVPVTVSFTPGPEGERWTRDFGGTVFSSLQTIGRDRNDALLVERFGTISIAIALIVEGDRLVLVPRRWSWFGVPLPKMLLPTGKSFECELDGEFAFNVDISMPVIGLIVAYQGILAPDG